MIASLNITIISFITHYETQRIYGTNIIEKEALTLCRHESLQIDGRTFTSENRSCLLSHWSLLLLLLLLLLRQCIVAMSPRLQQRLVRLCRHRRDGRP